MRKYITYDELNIATQSLHNAIVLGGKYAEGLTLDDFLRLTLAFVRAACGPKDYREIAEYEEDEQGDGDSLADIDAGVDDVFDRFGRDDT